MNARHIVLVTLPLFLASCDQLNLRFLNSELTIQSEDHESFSRSLSEVASNESITTFNQLATDLSMLAFLKDNRPLDDERLLRLAEIERALDAIELGSGGSDLVLVFADGVISTDEQIKVRSLYRKVGEDVNALTISAIHALTQTRLSQFREEIDSSRDNARQLQRQQRADQAEALRQLRNNRPGRRGQAEAENLSRCPIPKLDSSTHLAVVGVYEGNRQSPLEFEDESHATNMVDIFVPAGAQDTFLVLTAYDPVLWNISMRAPGVVRGVLVMGYHPQAVANLDSDIPVYFSTYEDGGESNCGKPMYAYKGGPELLALNERLGTVLGKEIDRFQGNYTGERFVVGVKAGVQVGADWLAQDVRIQDVVASRAMKPVSLLSGKAGIEQLVREGALRRATTADIQAWVTKASAPYQSLQPGSTVEHYMMVGSTYVALKTFTLPKDLFGGNSVSIIIPEGIAEPKIGQTHSTVYFMEDGTCNGPSPTCRNLRPLLDSLE